MDAEKLYYKQKTKTEFEKSSIQFFKEINHTQTNRAIYTEDRIFYFVYSNLFKEKVINSNEIKNLEKIVLISLLLKKTSDEFIEKSGKDINYYSIEIDTLQKDATKDVYDIHSILSKIETGFSVVLFKNKRMYLLSFHYTYSDGNEEIITSDWFDIEKIDQNYFNTLQAGNFSNNSIEDFFLDFLYFAVNENFIYPISFDYVRFEVAPEKIGIYDDENSFKHLLEESQILYRDEIEKYPEGFFDTYENINSEINTISDMDILFPEYYSNNNPESIVFSLNISNKTEYFDEMIEDEIVFDDPIKIVKYLEKIR